MATKKNLAPINPFQAKPAVYPQQDPSAYSDYSPIQAPAPASTSASPSADFSLPDFNRPVTPFGDGVSKAPDAATPSADNPSQTTLGGIGAVTSGFAAGSQVQPSTNSTDAVLGTIGAGVTGAASGAAIGSMVPGIGTAIGAGVGGVLGLVTGGIQAYTGLQDARAKKRAQEKVIAKVNQQQADAIAYKKQQDALARSDTQEQLRYNRHQDALNSQMTAFKSILDLLNHGMTQDQNMKELFMRTGR